jgi:hypothetical protein
MFDIDAPNPWSSGTLTSPGRESLTGLSAGRKCIFAGGQSNFTIRGISTLIDIYDAPTNTWTTAQLQAPRLKMVAAFLPASGIALFAGGNTDGFDNAPPVSDAVDLFVGANTAGGHMTIGPPLLVPVFETGAAADDFHAFIAFVWPFRARPRPPMPCCAASLIVAFCREPERAGAVVWTCTRL